MKSKCLIKDSNIRKALTSWALVNKTKDVVCYIGTWDHGGVCLINGVIEFVDVLGRISIQFFNAKEYKLENEKVYTIEELVGSEDETTR